MNLISRVVLAGAVALSLTGGARAADMPPLPGTDAAYDGQPQELGTNWYLRGDIGVIVPGNDKMFGNADGSAPQQGTKVGLRNVSERLSLHFGASAKLTAGPRPGGGFSTEILMPLRRG